MKATKFSEIRDMSSDQLNVLLKEAKDKMFRLRLQARMERLDSPSELKKNKVMIAQALTVMSLRKKAAEQKEIDAKNAEKKALKAQEATALKAAKKAAKAMQESKVKAKKGDSKSKKGTTSGNKK